MRRCWEKKFIRKQILLGIFCFSCLSEAAWALTIGPMQTKRERTGGVLQEAFPEGTPSESRVSPRGTLPNVVFYEQIEESFLKEDFPSVVRLAQQFLSTHSRNEQSDEVQYLEALSLIKMNRLSEGREKLIQLKQQSFSAEMKVRVASSLADSYSFLSGPGPNAFTGPGPKVGASVPLHQMGLEENYFFSVQVGSFSKQPNAERILNRLIRNHYEAYLDKDRTKRLFRVHVGKLVSRQEVLALEKRLKKDGYTTKIFPK